VSAAAVHAAPDKRAREVVVLIALAVHQAINAEGHGELGGRTNDAHGIAG